MKKIITGFMIICLAAGLSGCASIKSHFSRLTAKRDKAYLKARSTARVKVPAGLSARHVGDDYNVPTAYSHGPTPVAITPPGGISKAKVPGNPKNSAKKSSYFLKPLF